MKLKIISVYDSKAEAYGQPFYVKATGEAIRSFSDEANSTDKNSAIGQHPEDYTLFELGTVDLFTGEFDTYEFKRALGCGIDFVRSKMNVV